MALFNKQIVQFIAISAECDNSMMATMLFTPFKGVETCRIHQNYCPTLTSIYSETKNDGDFQQPPLES